MKQFCVQMIDESISSQWWKTIMKHFVKIGNEFEIRCWREEVAEIESASLYGVAVEDTVRVPGRGGRPILFCHRRLLSPGAKKGLSVAGKSLFVVAYSVLLCGCCCGGLCLSPCPVFPRLDTLILPLLFKVSRPVLP